MKRPSELIKIEKSMNVLAELTSAFEGIASINITKTKNRVVESTRFFNDLWKIYSQLEVDGMTSFGRKKSEKAKIDKELYIIITAEGGFSGDIDLKLISLMLKTYDKQKHDIIVIGHHGAIQLAQRSISYYKYFKLPVKDQNINVLPIIKEVQKYRSTIVFYQEYITLMNQQVKSIELVSAVKDRVSTSTINKEVINEDTYIFEPNTRSVTEHLERSMTQIAISQLILSSKLAQFASRFRAMSMAHEKADNEKAETHFEYNRSRRAMKDERLKEVVNGIKKSHHKVGAV